MLKNKLIVASLVGLCVIGTSFAIAATEVSLEGVKCLMVAKKDAKEDKAAKWKDGKVYFCCDGCLGKFGKMDDKAKEEIAAKANHQLVATKQYVQKGCPFSGGDIDETKSIEVAGAKVFFCCDGCKSKAEGMEGDKQVEALFGEKAFKTAKYEPTKEK